MKPRCARRSSAGWRRSRHAKIRTLVARGEAASEVGRIAVAEKTDLIILATHGWTGWRHLVFGSVAEKILREAPCPVLSIRKPAAAPPAA
jgi:nucleotide-binding universal stress UspA family protein